MDAPRRGCTLLNIRIDEGAAGKLPLEQIRPERYADRVFVPPGS
jgi:hypothetical protein